MPVFGCNCEGTFTEGCLSVKRYTLDGIVWNLGFISYLVLFNENSKYLHSFKLPLSCLEFAMGWS